jgi:hypothetical protein
MGCQLRFAARRQWRQGHHGVWRWQLEERFGYHVWIQNTFNGSGNYAGKDQPDQCQARPQLLFHAHDTSAAETHTDDAAKGPRFVPLQFRINGSTTDVECSNSGMLPKAAK